MATTEPIPSPPSPVSQDDRGGLWMEVDSNPAEDTSTDKDSPPLSNISGEKTSEDSKTVALPASTVPTGSSNGVGQEDDADDVVFIPPVPCTASSLPTEGSGSTVEHGGKVPNGASSVRETQVTVDETTSEKGVKQVIGSQEEVESTGGRATEEDKGVQVTSPVRSHINMEASNLTDQLQSQATETEMEKSTVSKEISTDVILTSEETHPEPTEDDHPPEGNSNPARPLSNMDDRETRELERPVEGSSNNSEEKVGNKPMDNSEIKQSVRKDSISCQSPFSISRDSPREEPTATSSGFDQQKQQGRAGEGPGVPTVPSHLQQGEQLLHRLHLVQKRQEEQQVSEGPPPSQLVVMETANQDRGGYEVDREESLRVGEEGAREQVNKLIDQGQSEILTEKQGESIGQVGREEVERGQDNTEGEEEAQVTFSITVQPSTAQTDALSMETNASDDDQSDSGVSADFSPVITQEVHSSQTSSNHQTHPTNHIPQEEEPQKDQSLKRSRGHTDPPASQDVVEIPFKSTTLLTRPLQPPKGGPGHGEDWQFSEKKMQKEISQQTQRELVLVNLGKFPGVYSKSFVGQLKERKLLFEAFQQGSTEGPTRHRRPPASSTSMGIRDHVYPSVLERTRSLEVLSHKRCSLSRTSSLKLQSSREGCSDGHPSADRLLAGQRVKRQVFIVEGDPTLLISQKDKHQRLSRSMDSLSLEDGVTELTTREGAERRERGDEGSATLIENPFFKLRPALALKPEVEKDIREAREREEELRRQRCHLYGEAMGASTEGDCPSPPLTRHPALSEHLTEIVSKGKLDRAWPPPPSSNIKLSKEQPQEPRPSKGGGQKTPLWQRWEAGMVNGQQPKEKD